MSKQELEKEKKIKPKVDLMPKYALQRKPFDDAKIRDIRSGKWGTWPYNPRDVSERVWKEHFLDKVVDDEGNFYPKRDEEGRPVKTTPDNIPKYEVTTIVRVKRKDNSEFLLSKGNFIGYDALGDKVIHFVTYPEVWEKTNFVYEKQWDDKKKMIVKNCMGPGGMEQVYTLEFNEKNLKQLFDKRQDDNINFVLKDEISSSTKAVAGVNIQETYKLFLKPFSYLFNAEYMTPEMKAYYRQEAIDQGLLSPPPAMSSAAPPNANNPNANSPSPRMQLG